MKRLLLLGCLLMVGCDTVSQPTPIPIPLAPAPLNVIVDTDVSVDDILAILYLMSRPDVNVRAITVSGTGITRCDSGMRNVRAVLEILQHSEIPVACGRETPLRGDHAFPKEWRDSAENFFGLNIQPAQFIAPDERAPGLLARTLKTSGAPVTLVALGPMTNLAEAFVQDSALTRKIERVYSMGGAVSANGNVAFMANTEWNFYIDPLAAERVLASDVPITLVPLDATNQVPASPQLLMSLRRFGRTPAARFAERILQTQHSEIERGAYYLWDPLAAVVATDSSLVNLQEMNLAVDSETGRTVRATGGTGTTVVFKVDAARFEATFLQTLNGQFK